MIDYDEDDRLVSDCEAELDVERRDHDETRRQRALAEERLRIAQAALAEVDAMREDIVRLRRIEAAAREVTRYRSLDEGDCALGDAVEDLRGVMREPVTP